MIFLKHKIVKMTINRQNNDKSSNLAAMLRGLCVNVPKIEICHSTRKDDDDDFLMNKLR